MNKDEIEIFKNLEIAVKDIAVSLSMIQQELTVLNTYIAKVIK